MFACLVAYLFIYIIITIIVVVVIVIVSNMEVKHETLNTTLTDYTKAKKTADIDRVFLYVDGSADEAEDFQETSSQAWPRLSCTT